MSGVEFEDNGGYPTTSEEMVEKAAQTSGDRLILKDGTKSSKHMAIAYMAAAGNPQKAIAESLGLTQAWVCTVLSQTEIKEEIKTIQAKHLGESIEKRFRASVHKSMDVMDGVIDDRDAKDRDRMQAAQWILEKVTGKATQTVEHSGNVLAGLMDQLDGMRASETAKPVGEQILEIEEKSSADNMIDAFVAGNVPSEVRVGAKGEEE